MKSTLCYLIGSIIFLFSSSVIDAQKTNGETTHEKGPLFYKEYHTKIHTEQKMNHTDLLKIVSKAGDVLLLPGDDDKVVVEADVVITSLSKKRQERFMNRYMNLTFSDENDQVSFFANFGGNRPNGFAAIGFLFRHLGTPASKINFTMYVPRNVYVHLFDGSGNLEVKNLSNNIEIKDGSGSMKIESVMGNVKIYDNAGDIRVENLVSVGEIIIHDESGNIYGNDIRGNMSIHDGSGSISLKNVSSMVEINDGSGDINVLLTDGLVNVNSDGSGGKHISYSDKD